MREKLLECLEYENRSSSDSENEDDGEIRSSSGSSSSSDDDDTNGNQLISNQSQQEVKFKTGVMDQFFSASAQKRFDHLVAQRGDEVGAPPPPTTPGRAQTALERMQSRGNANWMRAASAVRRRNLGDRDDDDDDTGSPRVTRRSNTRE